MNKTELIEAIADGAEITKSCAAKALDAALEAITKAVGRGDQVALVGFGTFLVKSRAERTGRNPQTGAAIQIAASNLPTFKAGSVLKKACN